MKRLLLLAVSALLVAATGLAEGLSGQALVAFEAYDFTNARTDGFRQTYDLRFDRAFTPTSLFRAFVRADDFNGSKEEGGLITANDFRQIQPTAELIVNAGTITAHARSDWFDTTSNNAGFESERTLERTTGQFTWLPYELPSLDVIGQRSVTKDDSAFVDLTDQNLNAQLRYEWRGLAVKAEERFAQSVDDYVGYSRTTVTPAAGLIYGRSAWDGRLTMSAQGDAQWQHLEQKALDGRSPSIPNPVGIPRAYYSVDETPTDGSDHPLASAPKLNDGDLNNTSALISLGPDGLSFQNLAFDLGRQDRVDEIRILVRDAEGNPLKIGGGAVLWDVYTSLDGILWTPVADSITTFNGPLSLYSVTFPLTTARWFKVVNFGVNIDTTFVTELQAFYHVSLIPGGERKGDQTIYSGFATVTAQPFSKLLASYTGLYSALDQNYDTLNSGSTSDIEHIVSLHYQLRPAFALRGDYLTRDSESFSGTSDTADQFRSFLDYTPTQRLLVSLELSRENQVLAGSEFTIDTKAIHSTGQVVRSLFYTLDGGVQTQTFSVDQSEARRTYFNVSSTAQLTPTIRFLLNGTMQRTTSDSTDPATQLLGPQQDDRVSGEFIYRPGRELTLNVRLGYATGSSYSGFTQRYHVEWYPFGGGTVSIGGSYDEDLDPSYGRHATRAIFNPRWNVNRFAAFDLNYTDVKTVTQDFTQRQRTLYATFTLTLR